MYSYIYNNVKKLLAVHKNTKMKHLRAVLKAGDHCKRWPQFSGNIFS